MLTKTHEDRMEKSKEFWKAMMKSYQDILYNKYDPKKLGVYEPGDIVDVILRGIVKAGNSHMNYVTMHTPSPYWGLPHNYEVMVHFECVSHAKEDEYETSE